MSKKIVSTLAGLIVLLAAVSLHARSNQMQVTIPFGFVAGGKTLPAGNYIVELNTDSGTRGVIVLRRDGQQPILLVVAIGKEYFAVPEHSQLVFHRYGTSFFLSEVRTEGDTTGRALATSDREKEMARNSRPDQKIVAEVRHRP
jgi:hypothetical protein